MFSWISLRGPADQTSTSFVEMRGVTHEYLREVEIWHQEILYIDKTAAMSIFQFTEMRQYYSY